MEISLQNNEEFHPEVPEVPKDPSTNNETLNDSRSFVANAPQDDNIILEPVQSEPLVLGELRNALKSDLKAQVEAVLFVTDAPLKTGAISKLLNTGYDDVQAALVQLIQEYEDRNCGLEISTDEGYIIQVRAQYLNIVTDMMPLELNPGPMRTLSAVALKEPVLQSEIVDMRGSGAYDHIFELVEKGLITKKPQGLSYILRTTKKFSQYFRFTQEASKIREKLEEEAIRLAKEKEKRKQEEELAKAIPEVTPE